MKSLVSNLFFFACPPGNDVTYPTKTGSWENHRLKSAGNGRGCVSSQEGILHPRHSGFFSFFLHKKKLSIHLKNMIVKLDHFPRGRGENKNHPDSQHLPVRTIAASFEVANITQSPQISGLTDFFGNHEGGADITTVRCVSRCLCGWPIYFIAFVSTL